ncbi:hypothetical protein AAFC00_003073 [Neodothiora populina]|uniref:Pentatricopeptide repeat-containing protein n=1 Tax=Neodothiora populina TaxID=2781224 RepID=A0ABR3P971_9PEZI
MTVPYVCSACYHRMMRQSVQCAASKRQVAWASSQVIEDILSDSPPVPRTVRRPRYATTPRDSAPNDDFTSYIANAASSPKTIGRYSRQPRAVDSGPRPVTTSTETNRTSQSQRSYTAELEILVRNSQLLEAWDFFCEHYSSKDSPALARPSFRDVAKVRSGNVFAFLLARLVTAWNSRLNGADSDLLQLPSPSDVVKRFEQVGIATPATYMRTLASMSTALLKAGVTSTFDPEEYSRGVKEHMDLWRLCLQRDALAEKEQDQKPDADSHPSPWSFIPHDLLVHRRATHQDKRFDHNFALLVPVATSGLRSGTMAEKGRFNHLAASALVTYDLLNYVLPKCDVPSSSTEPYTGFIKSIDELFKHTTMDPARVSALSQRLQEFGLGSEEVQGLVTRLGHHVRQEANNEVHQDPSHSNDSEHTSQQLIRGIGRASERQDLDSLEKIWKKAQPFCRSQVDATSKDAVTKLYQQFLIAFFKLKRPQSALNIWNTMIKSNIEPSVHTWSIMMKGCQYSRDTHIMESLWHRMRQSGVQPDGLAWGTRIHGLLKTRLVQEGLRALEEMGREWIDAQKRRGRSAKNESSSAVGNNSREEVIDGIPKPDTAILNSALSALGNKFSKHIPDVLAWSKTFDIQPNIITFNTLINIYLAQERPEEAHQLLNSMAAANVQPDSNTFTILLNSMFYSSMLKGLSRAEQEETVMQYIASLESAGMAIDEKGYGLLVDRLLKEYGNLKAVQAVLAHMARSNVEPTTHIYTILMTYYFDSDPPDFQAADALWNQIRSRNHNYGAVLDVIFYDRMVEAYARHGNVGQTMAFLTRMSKEGKRPGWLAMAAVIKCLADNEEWDRLKQVVLDCHRQEGLLSTGLRGVKGQTDFWQLAADLGVLDDLGINVYR